MSIEREYDICIIGGCGHVGLPLGIAFAKEGKKVALYDINTKVIAIVNKGSLPFKEDGAEQIMKEVVASGNLAASNDTTVISQSENVISVIGTPVDEHLNPRYQDVIAAMKEIEPFIDDDQLLVLRSTLYPGVTEKVSEYLLSEGKKTDIAFCPERIAEGKALTELYELPQIISGVTESAVKRADKLFKNLAKKTVVLSPTEAELAKLFTNTWRYISFAISNEFYEIAEQQGHDFKAIYEAMTLDYPRLAAFARPGLAAGPCLFKDTMQLSAYSNNRFFLGHSAMLVNEGTPNFLVSQLKKTVDLSDKTIAVLGMAFKAENDDPRESLSYKLRKVLSLEAKDVICSDEYIKDPTFVSAQEAINNADIIFIATPHKAYATLDYQGKQVVDIWNHVNKEKK